ncbi:MAG: BON domain-containing protein [Planctomycetota bacterium]|nr:MAG: BON domain-containing protein [Planctomycetota bacterium]
MTTSTDPSASLRTHVPPASETVDASVPQPCDSFPATPPYTAELHERARSVYCRLVAHPGLAVEQLTVRCSRDAVYLSGSVQLLDETLDLLDLARELSGIEDVVSHVIVRRRIPPKG